MLECSSSSQESKTKNRSQALGQHLISHTLTFHHFSKSLREQHTKANASRLIEYGYKKLKAWLKNQGSIDFLLITKPITNIRHFRDVYIYFIYILPESPSAVHVQVYTPLFDHLAIPGWFHHHPFTDAEKLTTPAQIKIKDNREKFVSEVIGKNSKVFKAYDPINRGNAKFLNTYGQFKSFCHENSYKCATYVDFDDDPDETYAEHYMLLPRYKKLGKLEEVQIRLPF